jgi:hypothetical protein
VEPWRYQFPSVTVTQTHTGDPNYAARFYGDAMNLLYQLKNQMTFRKLGQLKMVRIFTDGTVITAKSIFGMDFLNIDVSRSRVSGTAEPSCTITIVETQNSVPPMRYPGEIKYGEVEGVDYIKTHFSVDLNNCLSCVKDPVWSFLFRFIDPPNIPYSQYTGDPADHVLVSIDGGAYGEVLETGLDSQGKYILWKVYTEGANQNRSGWGYFLLKGEIKDEFGKTICQAQYLIEVECCLKDGLQPVDIYWECGTWTPCESDPLEIYGGALGRVPSHLSYLQLSDCIAKAGGCRFFALPEVGGCPPYEWTLLSGPGSIHEVDTWFREVIYQGEDNYQGCENIMLQVEDRCGSQDLIVISCCDTAEGVTIEYTTLEMQCDGEQSLYVSGGCPPYQWTTSEGTIEPGPSGLSAKFTAPSSNADCAHNPTVTVMDCCGSSTSITINVNCYTGADVAYVQYYWIDTGIGCPGGEPLSLCKNYRLDRATFRCDGVMVAYSAGVSNVNVCSDSFGFACPPVCSKGVPPVSECQDLGVWGKCYDYNGWGCWGCDGCHDFACNGQAWDCRTAGMIAAGCCPINPYTGLPF